MPAPRLTAATQTRLAVHTTSDDAFLRVLAVARQRGFAITAVDYSWGDQHRPGRLELAVSGGSPGAQRLVACLERLVNVTEVERIT